MLVWKAYKNLPDEAVEIRKEVFMDEQGFTEEFDEIDNFAHHLVLLQDDYPVGTCRYFWNKEMNQFVLGRVAVRKPYRGNAYGVQLVKKAEEEVRAIGCAKLFLAAQVRAKAFYEKLGYEITGEVFLEEDCPHVWMCKDVS